MSFELESFEPRKMLASDFSASVNFQPMNAQRAPGLLVDYGSTFGVRRGGISYGWSTDLSASAVERNVTAVQRNDTFINIPSGASWEIAVPNGSYKVFLVSGDPAGAKERIGIAVEGTIAIAGRTNINQRYLEGNVTVNVTDGKLTVASAGAFSQDKINYISIVGTTDDATPSQVTNKIKWTTGTKALVARTEPQSAVVDGKFYVFSGYGDITGTGGDGWQPSKSYERYDSATGKWTNLGNMPLATTHAAVAVVGKDIWFAGGYTARPGTTTKQDIGSTNVWIYHTANNTWEKGPAIPQKRASGGMAMVGTKLYFVSGEPVDHKSNSKEVWALDVNNRSAGWVAKASIPDGRTHFGIAVVKSKIYVIGGQHNIDANATFLKDNYSYDPATNKWTRLADMPGPLSHLSPNTIVINDRIFTFGGEYKFNFDTADVLQYDPAKNTFTKMTPLPGIRASGAAGYVAGKIIFTGGKLAGNFNKDTWIGTFV